MAFTRTQIIIIGLGLLLILFVVLLFAGIIPGLRSTETQDISGAITIWGTADSKAVIEETLIATYNAIHPAVTVAYEQKNAGTYEEELINALASGRGPDAYFIRNNWVPMQADKLSPLTDTEYPLANLQATFPSAAQLDLTLGTSTTYGFPAYIDTLALFYNRNLFDNAGIANPPANWEELEQIVPRLRQTDASQKIVRSAIALGGSGKSVSHAADILSLMMLQDGVVMNTPDSFAVNFTNGGGKVLTRYLRFANPADELYTWNDQMGSDLEAFAKGEVAMMIGYRADIARIKEKNPFFNFGIAPMLQHEGASLAVNYPSYQVLVVSNTSLNSGLAWDFIGTTLLSAENVAGYLEQAGHTPALRLLIAEAVNDSEFGLFARQALTAKSWLQIDGPAVEEVFSQMIESVLTGALPSHSALETAEETINALVRQKTQL